MKKHNWVQICQRRVIDTDVYGPTWECTVCGSQTSSSMPPNSDSLDASHTFEDCDLALVAVVNKEAKFNQY